MVPTPPSSVEQRGYHREIKPRMLSPHDLQARNIEASSLLRLLQLVPPRSRFELL